jgi:hypothetical protein
MRSPVNATAGKLGFTAFGEEMGELAITWVLSPKMGYRPAFP